MAKAKSTKKSKSSFNIKEFIVQHCEKVIFGISIPIALYFASQGLNYETLKWKPQELVEVSNAAKRTIDSNDRTAFDEGVVVFRFDDYANSIKSEVKRDYYRTTTIWDASIYPELNPRTKPEVLPVYKLRASTGIGAIQIRSATTPGALGNRPATGGGFPMTTDTMSGSTGTAATAKDPKRWVVLTGLIPIREQFDRYLSIFPSAKFHDPFRDTPMYVKYDVERCEVTATGTTAWKKLEVGRRFKEEVVNKWAGRAPEIVDQTYIPPTMLLPMVYPLPPVANKTYGNEVTQPTIPLLSDVIKEDQSILQKRMEEYQKKQLEYDPSIEEGFNPFGTGTAANRRNANGSMPSDSMSGTGINGMFGTEDSPENSITVTDYLYRFFDFDVEQGKTYRYRVTLYLMNPNYLLDAANLDDPKIAEERFLVTQASEESNAITVGADARVLTAGVNAPALRRAWDEPTASLMLVDFDMTTGGEWYIEEERVYRGMVANYPNSQALSSYIKQAVSTTDSSMGGSSASDSSSRSTSSKTPTKKPAKDENRDKSKRNVESDVCIVDMSGGIAFPAVRGAPELRSPGKILMMEANGMLVIKSPTEDALQVELYKKPTATTGSDYGMLGGSSGSMN
ncbi:MAG: hypothetical protein LBU65_06645 [Planctomycetaceae bacterium]|jgi:hypothetical protein|nr:hypothetical protein [Planctomycetaceae bacterium]